MTTILAWKNPEDSTILIGSDTQSRYIYLRNRSKWSIVTHADGTKVAIGVAGSIADFQHAQDWLIDHPKSTAKQFALDIHEYLKNLGCADDSTHFILVLEDEIYSVYLHQRVALLANDGDIVWAGSGGDFAIGAWEALTANNTAGLLSPKQIMAAAIQAATRRDLCSGGEPWVEEIKPLVSDSRNKGVRACRVPSSTKPARPRSKRYSGS